MIAYDPGRWGVSFAFQLKGSVFPRAFAWACPCALCSTILQIHVHENQTLADGIYPGGQAATLLGGFWAILGFLVVFRSQHAYTRWWEGATLLLQIRGEWYNAFSSCLAFCDPDPAKHDEINKFQHLLVRLMSLLYNCALQQVATQENHDFELISLDGFDIRSMNYLGEVTDRVPIVLQWVQKLIVDSERAGILRVAPPILTRIHNQLGNGIVAVNNARKISEFPVPFPYTQMLTVMLMFHWPLTVFMCAVLLEHWYWAAILSFVVVFAFWSINYMAIELELPFGDDENDLPMQGMMRDMNDSLIELLDERAQLVPSFDYKAHLHSLCAREEHDRAANLVESPFLRLAPGNGRMTFHQLRTVVRDPEASIGRDTPFWGSDRRSRPSEKSNMTSSVASPGLELSSSANRWSWYRKRTRNTFVMKQELSKRSQQSKQSAKQSMPVADVKQETVEPESRSSREVRIADEHSCLGEPDTKHGEMDILPEEKERVEELQCTADQVKAAAASNKVDDVPNLSAALPGLSKLVETQVRELSHSVKALKEFSDALPSVIDSMLVSNIKHERVNSIRTSRGGAQGRSPGAESIESGVPASSDSPHICCRLGTVEASHARVPTRLPDNRCFGQVVQYRAC